MSGFSADWLALREPADHAARNGDVLAHVARHVAGRDHLSIIDLGCGAGSNLRGFALSLPARRQSWTLIDYDAALLKAARERLIAWADETGRTVQQRDYVAPGWAPSAGSQEPSTHASRR